MAQNKKIPKKLYKFRDATEYHLDSLSKDYLFFSYRKQLNDPYDIPIHFVDKNGLYFEDDHSMSRKNSFSDIGIFSLTKDRYSSVMWGHYAKNHTGFCVEIDTVAMESSLIENNKYCELNPIRKVKYYNSPPKTILVPGQFKPADIIKRLYWKNKQWKYEQEYRWTGFSNDYNFDQKIYYDSSCILKVIFGFNIEKKIENQLISICDSKGFKWKKAKFEPSSYRVK